MKPFNGFPAKMEFTPLPNLFFSALLPEITDMAELKATLYAVAAIYRKKGYPRYVTCRELLGDAALMSNFKDMDKPDEALMQAMKTAVERGTFIHIGLDSDGTPEHVYLVNTEANRQVAARIQSGELRLGGLKAPAPAHVEAGPVPDIFTLYEQNIGMLTPMIAEELREAEKLYPQDWIGEAIRVAVNHGKRRWSYISAVLERWSVEGKDDGAYRRDTKEDPNKFIKGRYGHMVQR